MSPTLARLRQVVLSDDLALPIDVVTEAIWIVAKRRVGKSYTARRIVEQLLGAGLQNVIIDPKGDWWGLRSAADGKAPGFPILIAGGEHGDVPLEAGAGEALSHFVVEQRVNLLVDLSQFRKHEIATFMTGFLEALYRLKAQERFRTPMMLTVDEADAIGPQRPQKGEERMLGAYEDVVRRGGQRGIGSLSITQRSAVLNKNITTQAQVLIALRTISPQDLAAIDPWVEVHGSGEQRQVLMASLPSLPVGTAWVWSPGWPTDDGIFQRIAVGPISTFDSGATPKVGQKIIPPKSLAEVDLGALTTTMAETIAKAKAEDPKELRKQIATLERELRERDRRNENLQASAAARVEIRTEYVDKPVITADDLAALQEFALLSRNLGRELVEKLQVIGETLTRVEAGIELAGKTAIRQADMPANPQADMPTPPMGKWDEIKSHSPALPTTRAGRARAANGQVTAVHEPSATTGLSTPQMRVLNSVATLHALGLDQPQRPAVAALARYAPTNGNFKNILSELKTMGHLVYPVPGTVMLTDSGHVRASADVRIRTLQDLHDAWLDVMTGPQKKVMAVLLRRYPDPINRNELAQMTGYVPSNGNFKNIISELKTLAAATYPTPGCVVATEILFPKLPSTKRR